MKRMYLFGIVPTTVVMAVLILVGCTQQIDMPPAIQVDITACGRCKMLLSDTRFAAAVKADKYITFDDIGCMLTYVGTHPGVDTTSMWVRDYAADKWIPIRSAVFFTLKFIRTPMGYGYVAFEDGSPGIAKHTDCGTRIGRFQELKTRFASQ